VSLRRVAAFLFLAAWVGVLAWQARRLYLRPESQRVASAARLIPPGVAYYRVSRAGRRVGWAQSEIDTLPAGNGFRLTDRIVIEIGALAASLGSDAPRAGLAGGTAGAGRATAEIRSEAEVGPTLSLRWFRASASGLLGGLSGVGRVVGDSLLVVSAADSTGRPRGAADTIRTGGPLVFENAVPLRLAVEQRAGAGDSVRIRIFDPLGMGPRMVTLRILERATRTYPDSADTDSLTGRWEAVRLDTVRAWKVARETGGMSVTSWVDEDGRILEASLGGFELRRTAFELAFYGFQGETGRGAPGQAGPDTVAGSGPRGEPAGAPPSRPDSSADPGGGGAG
jgi:hypothetical protein